MDYTLTEALTLTGLLVTGLIVSNAKNLDPFSTPKSIKLDVGSPKIETKPIRRKMAVLVADTNDWNLGLNFSNTMNLAYDSLRECGYLPDDIHVLTGKKKPSFRANISDCNKRSFYDVVENLSKDLTDQDLLFFMFLTHGSPGLALPHRNIGEKCLALGSDKKDRLSESDLIKINASMSQAIQVYLFNSCFGGSFAQSVGFGKSIGISPSKSDKMMSASMPYILGKKYGEQASTFTLGFLLGMREGFMSRANKRNFSKPTLEDLFDFGYDFHDLNSPDLRENVAFRRVLLMAKEVSPLYKMLSEYGPRVYDSINRLGKASPILAYDKINPSQIHL